MASSNTRETRKALQQRYRDRRGASGIISAYEDQSGFPRDTSGDEEGPWVKAPPFTEDPQRWIEPFLLPSADAGAAYVTLPPVDVKQYRFLAVYITYTIPVAGAPPPPQGVGQLSLVPEMRSLGDANQEAWYTTSMVDLAFTPTTLNPPFSPIPFASRTFFPSELRWPAAAVGPVAVTPLTMRTRLLFDVSDAEAFRLNVQELNEDSNLENTFSALYARSQ